MTRRYRDGFVPGGKFGCWVTGSLREDWGGPWVCLGLLWSTWVYSVLGSGEALAGGLGGQAPWFGLQRACLAAPFQLLRPLASLAVSRCLPGTDEGKEATYY